MTALRPSRAAGLGPMLIVALIAAALYWPLMLAANVGPAGRTLASGAELECATRWCPPRRNSRRGSCA